MPIQLIIRTTEEMKSVAPDRVERTAQQVGVYS